MLLSGERLEMEQQLTPVLAGYTEFMDFNPAELRLIEPLRTLRMLHYNAWLAKRWDDPAFPRAFPWFAGRTLLGRTDSVAAPAGGAARRAAAYVGTALRIEKIIKYGVPGIPRHNNRNEPGTMFYRMLSHLAQRRQGAD